MKFSYKPAGDSSILMELEVEINESTNRRLISLADFIEQNEQDVFGEVIIGYRSLLVQYNPLQISYSQAIDKLKNIDVITDKLSRDEGREIEIPVLYGGEYGPDLISVASHNNLSTEEVISIHSESRYLVYFLGFTPGYPFLGGMSSKIATPRLEKPRISIPPGSVGIANNQTGIYPVESPGGWRLVGRTPVKLYNAEAEDPFLLHPGDHVTFKQVALDEFEHIKEQVASQNYTPNIKHNKNKNIEATS
ncbi:5-oxoprolinase subunit PxpB [Thalassobacillus devorans]|uniref:5-oxoprolinase subunit PxpB n=1 Tax=Thalassobacillus devorans TaxID=279813 RepID=UPI000A1C859B|nr:5-oxoprolinase subunit PxpB [Thalassobacillus devorans]